MINFEIMALIDGKEQHEPAADLDAAKAKARELTQDGPAEYAAVMVDGVITYEYEKPHTYKAKNGFTLKDAWTPGGWIIKTPDDILTALLNYPEFETVAAGFIWQAIDDAAKVKKEYENIDDLKDYLTENYI